MNTSIFGKKLSKLTTDDIREFCEKQIKEGINLDYKRDLSSGKTIAKTIASMANTLGGWILVGVEDDGDDNPLLPVKGLEFEEQLQLKISSIVIDNISPPIFPIVHVCEPDKNNKTFIVLYVFESSYAPHWMFNDNKLLIRRADRSSSASWERLASSDEWEFLREKRSKAEQLRLDQAELLDELFYEYDYRSELEYEQTQPVDPLKLNISIPKQDRESRDLLSINVSPKYPTRQLFEVEEGEELIRKLRFNDVYGTDSFFPFLTTDIKYFGSGVSMYGSDINRQTILFFALNSFAMFSFKEKVVEEIGQTTFVRLSRLLVKFKQNLILAKSLYEELNYMGIIHIDLLLHMESWTDLLLSDQQSQSDRLQCPLDQISFSKDLMLSDLSDEIIDATVEEFYRKIANSFRWEPSRRFSLADILNPFNL